MCGICGIATVSPTAGDNLASVMAMSDGMAHRGPDGDGRFVDSHVALAMRRLSIIDLVGGWQPLFNEDRSIVLIVNGEIYNYIELRDRLQLQGHHLATGSDCETIVHLYEEYGLDCVHHLRGMFAFALWDARSDRLVLARDRMGEKPLYFYERDGCLVFASEMKALLRSRLVPFNLDPVSVNMYLHYQYVPEPRTPLVGVNKLDAGHLLVVDAKPWRIEQRCYWKMEDAPALEGSPAQLIRAQLDTVAGLVIRSDVPVGVALSGGLDSSAIAVLANRHYPGTLHAFSVGYVGRPPNDERAAAASLARHLHMPFHEIEISIGECVERFPSLVAMADDPIADISALGYFSVMRAAREHGVPVMLQGQGGDELFWGYNWVRQSVHRSAAKGRQQATLRQAFMRFLAYDLLLGFSRRSRPHILREDGGLAYARDRIQTYLHAPEDQLLFMDLAPDFILAQLSGGRILTRAAEEQLLNNSPSDLFRGARYWDNLSVSLTSLICSTYLRENGIAQGDRLSMASSVELRLPLLDYRLVETVIGLRKTYDDAKLAPKSWLKAALKDVVPPWVLRRPKRGFTPPVREWHAALFERYGMLLRDGYLVQSGMLTPVAARTLSTGLFPQGAVAPLSFKALVLEQWCRSMQGLGAGSSSSSEVGAIPC